MKSIVQKISGFAKFELDHKLSLDHFRNIVMKLSMVKDTSQINDKEKPVELVFSQERFDRVNYVFIRAYKENAVVFQGDLENELYKSILAAFREHTP